MNNQIQSHSFIVIENSPIECLVIGPVNGRDRVIIRSTNAGLDLLGLAIDSPVKDVYSAVESSPVKILMGLSRKLNIVETYPVDDLNPLSDFRQSKMKFAWVGECSTIQLEMIQRSFERAQYDLKQAFISDDADKELVEWSIAPVVLQCSIAHERRLRFRRLFYMTLAAYGIMGLLTLGVLIAKNLLIFG